MNIKSLLLGTAATMVAVSSAQAADAIVVEPEPVEYVRICDAYGAGFFYIPGTETCMRFSGFVRSSYEAVSRDGVDAAGAAVDVTDNFWGNRARLDIDVRSETDWGTLRAQYRLEGGDSAEDADIDMDRALISIAGFRFGFTDNYWSTNHGYAGINGLGLGVAFSAAIDDGWYGFDDATIADYTFAIDNLAITVGVEDTRISYGSGDATTPTGGPGTTPNGTATDGTNSSGNNANWYVGANYSDSWGGAAFTYVEDKLSNGEAWKVSLDLNLSDYIPGGAIHFMYMQDGDDVTDYVHNYLALANPDDIFQVSAQMDLTEELQLVGQYSTSDGAGVDAAADADHWSVALNWFPTAAPQFSVRAAYTNLDVNNASAGSAGGGGTYDADGFVVSVRRSF